MSQFKTIIVERDETGIVTLTLNRPEKHHALNAAMIAELTEVAQLLAADAAVRAVILAATGPSFCAGGDLDWMRQQQAADRQGKLAEAGKLSAMLSALDALPKPLLARVEGHVYGGGIGLLAVCDLAIAATGVRFALSETRLGLIPATIGPFVLRRMGPGLARQVFFSGQTFGTDFALRAGLVHEVHSPDEIDAKIATLIQAILKTAPRAVAAAKSLCLTLGPSAQHDDIQRSISALADAWEGDEAQTRIRAFLGD